MDKPPIIADTAKRVQHIEKIRARRLPEFLLFFLGICTFFLFGIGVIFIVVAIIISICRHDKKIITWRCSACGNEVVETSTICPTCKKCLA
jgi:rubrerythrin